MPTSPSSKIPQSLAGFSDSEAMHAIGDELETLLSKDQRRVDEEGTNPVFDMEKPGNGLLIQELRIGTELGQQIRNRRRMMEEKMRSAQE